MSVFCPSKKIKENSDKMSDAVEAVEDFDIGKIKEIFTNDYFTNGNQKTSEWAWLGKKGKNVENWINRLFAASKDNTTKAVNRGARKMINSINTNNLKKDIPYTFEYTTPYI